MTGQRDRPYVQFNFLVRFGTGGAAAPSAGFEECVIAERAPARGSGGPAAAESAEKITGVHKATDVTLKRGVIDASELNNWLNQVRKGEPGASRTVVIQLQNKQRNAVTQSWNLGRARIIKHTSGPLNAKGNDVAIEELVLSCERIEIS